MITEIQKQNLINEYIKQKHNADECIGFIDGVDLVASIFESSEKDLENRIRIIKLLQVIGYVGTPSKTAEWDDYHILNPYLGNITNILVKDNKITLICLRPGLVIGKGGRNFDYIKQQIESDLEQSFDFEIVEDRFWNVY